jgi:signal transduction histidine kinase/ligand-binding sensor domain-containing protein/ActR/RegA family two-component response regulator
MVRIFLIAGFSFLFCIASLTQERIMINYSLEEGIPQASVLCMYQDKSGNMWFGTQGGVAKFNGSSFKTYDTRLGFADNHITSIYQAVNGNYWFGHRYKGITILSGDKVHLLDLTEIQISAICEDEFGNMWIGSIGDGLYMLPANAENIKSNYRRMDVALGLPEAYIIKIRKDINGRLLVASTTGLSVIQSSFSPEKISMVTFNTKNSGIPFDDVISFDKESEDIYWLMGISGLAKAKLTGDKFHLLSFHDFGKAVPINFSNNIICDGENTIWGAYDKGIFRFSDGKFDFSYRGTGYFNNETSAILLDQDKNLWIGTIDRGVLKYSGDKFIVFDINSGLQSNIINSVIKDRSGMLWISTDGGTCSYLDGNFTDLSDKIPFDHPVSVIFEDSRGKIWLGNVYRDPILRYDPVRKVFTKFEERPDLPSTSVITISEDAEGCIWFASVYGPPFRYSYPGKGKPEKFESFTKEDGLCSNIFWIIHRDGLGNLWFGSDDAGITKYDGKQFITFNKKDGLTNLSAGAITHDSHNNLWIATIGGGIFKFDGKHFVNYNIRHGLSSDNPFSIICDEQDIVWIGTNTGIDRFDPATEIFKHYGKSDGFIGIENNQNAIFRDNSGVIWFGTVNGLIRFDPKLDQPNLRPPVTVIEKIKLFFSDFNYTDYSRQVDPVSGLPRSLELGYKKNHLTFEYVGISHAASDRVNYQYKLENFDEDWNPVTKATTATYTNIPAGEYTFRVKAANNDGYWDEQGARLSFTILPPYWQKTWFRVLAFIAGISAIYFIFWLRLRSIKAQKLRLEKLVDEKTIALKQEAEERMKAQLKAEEADRLKTAFLANMSHEIRTPVNSIIGFSDLLKDEDVDQENRNLYLDHIINGGNTLLTLINDIIDVSRIEAGQLRIADDACNLSAVVRELFPVLFEILKKKNKQNVELRIASGINGSGPVIYTDPNRLKQILINLIGNAIKFTDTGYIEYGYEVMPGAEIRFYVKDTGIGIPRDKQEIIFHRFRQVEETYTRNYDGTGLGLSISKKLVSLMGGEMWVESAPGEGSVFYFTLPYRPVETDRKIYLPVISEPDPSDLNGRTILVAEDEYSNFLLLENLLNKWNIAIIHTTDGKDAVTKFEENQGAIDLVLMDIKMPGLDGYEATRQIKRIGKGVPVIAQTAYAMADEREKCLACGCDDYISKPYSKQQLFEVIHRNLLTYHKIKQTAQ